MPGLRSQPASPFEKSGHAFAVTVYKTSEGSHAGMFFLDEAGLGAVVHLAWHHDVRAGGIGGPWVGGLWAAPAMEPENERVFAGLCRLLVQKYANNRTSIPYAAKYVNSRFNPGTLGWTPGVGVSGLTCATFILTTLNTYGLPLLLAEEWVTRPGDAEWLQYVVDELGKQDPVHAARVQAEVGCARFRPTDVLGGAAADAIPASFAVATGHGAVAAVMLRLA